jgi:photosystem II stability/assembly factor-like uncharacterized protein/tetratricopeptide (TPR) repeat protein
MRSISLVFALLAGLPPLTLLSNAPARAAAPRAFDDAPLHAVQFVDANEGWAVGDDGVVWHSIDAGRNWERQPTGTRASLRSLQFLNPYTGWIAGREELPNGGGSVGILLFTQDGGLRWRRVLTNSLPGLNVVRFVDTKVGYLAGDGTDLYPSGVFVTSDSGHNWQPVPGPRCTSWLAGDFNADGGSLAGAWDRLGSARKDRISLADADQLGGRNVCGVLLRGKRGIAVGQGGLVLRSEGTNGSTWGFVELGLDADVLAAWDFHAVHGAGKHIWAVGRPGSAVLHSGDSGDHWQIVPTGQPLPLDGVWFQDEAHGWAVGELGSILATADGGKTWQVQRRGGQRAAVLCIHARAAGLVTDTLARLGAEEGYLVAALRVTGSDPVTASPARSGEGARFAEAVRQAGGATGESLWQFPIGSHLAGAARSDLLQAWDKLHGDRAADQLLRQIVLAIRIWQPDVVLTDGIDKDPTNTAADTLVTEAVREAFQRAGDPRIYPEQIDFLGLSPRSPVKAYGRWSSHSGQVTYDLTAVSKVLEATYRDYATPAASLLAETPVTLPVSRSYRLLVARGQGAETHRDLMETITLAPGSLARRSAPAPVEETAEVEQTLRKLAALQALTEVPPGLGTSDRLLGQLGPMLSELPDQQGAQAAFAVATHYVRLGQWELAREAFLLMVERYPAHALSVDAYRWLIRHGSSSEARRRHELGQFLVMRQQEFGIPEGGETRRTEKPKPGDRPPKTMERRQESISLLSNEAEVRKWYRGSLELESRLAAFGPLFANDPSVQFCLQAAKRNLGDFDGAKLWYTRFVAKQPEGPWRDAAAAELWLTNRQGPPPKPVVVCRFASTRPYLDGKLDDECWQGRPSLTLKNAAGDTLRDYPTEVRLARDKEFLYLAFRCFHPASRHIEPTSGRKHDEDLRDFDRVSLMLDLDRDYSTCFHFQIDQRGHVAEDCWGDKTWNPSWYVAIHSEATVWTIEAAIPLVALTGDAVSNGKAWAFNVVRTVPGQGVQAFSLPADVPEVSLRPEGMGLLMFAQDAKQTAAAPDRPMPRVP